MGLENRIVWLYPGTKETLKDCSDECPEMTVVPAGAFLTGTAEGPERKFESPQHSVKILKAFAIGRFEVTRSQFEAFVRATGHDVGDSCELWSDGKWTDVKGKSFGDPGFDQTGDHPAVCISWEDAQAYVRWLGVKTGKTYRLPSEAEWEYAARAGSVTDYWWGPVIDAGQANYGKRTTSLGPAGTQCRACLYQSLEPEPVKGTMAASSFRPNPWGLA